MTLVNPLNGSWGIIKVQPTQRLRLILNPPNGSLLLAKSDGK